MTVFHFGGQEWIEAEAAVEVDKFLKTNGMDIKQSVPILDFADYIGLEVLYYKYKDKRVLGTIDSKENAIVLNERYEDNYPMEVCITSYLLGLYYLANRQFAKSKAGFKEGDLEKLESMGVNLKKLKSSDPKVQVLYTLYDQDLKDVKEGDPDLYYFSRELVSRDIFAQNPDREP